MLRLNGLSYKNEFGLIWKIFSKGFSTSYDFLHLKKFYVSISYKPFANIIFIFPSVTFSDTAPKLDNSVLRTGWWFRETSVRSCTLDLFVSIPFWKLRKDSILVSDRYWWYWWFDSHNLRCFQPLRIQSNQQARFTNYEHRCSWIDGGPRDLQFWHQSLVRRRLELLEWLLHRQLQRLVEALLG